MKIRLKTRKQKIKERATKKRIEKERKEYINKFPKEKREEAENLLDRLEFNHRAQNKYGIISLMAIGAFFLMYSYGFLTWNILTQGIAGAAFVVFAYSFVRMVISAWKGDRCKRNIAVLRRE